MTEQKLHKELERIAKEHLIGVETLERRCSDSLDFHDIAVWCLEDALKAAFELGLKEAKKEVKK